MNGPKQGWVTVNLEILFATAFVLGFLDKMALFFGP
jgi:hypothetical protein